MTQHMWTELGVGGHGVAGHGLVLADDPGDPAAAELRALLVDEHRVVVVTGPLETVFGQVGVQQCCRVVAKGDVAGLVAFAGQGCHGRDFKPDIADGEVGDLLDPGHGVVEGGERGRVAAAPPGRPVGLGEQTAGLLDAEVAHGRFAVLLGRDGENVLAAGHLGRVLRLHPPVERTDHGQALVPGRDAVVPAGLEPVQEPGDHGGVDAVEGEIFRGDGSVVAEEDDQQLERVAIGRNRVG